MVSIARLLPALFSGAYDALRSNHASRFRGSRRIDSAPVAGRHVGVHPAHDNLPVRLLRPSWTNLSAFPVERNVHSSFSPGNQQSDKGDSPLCIGKSDRATLPHKKALSHDGNGAFISIMREARVAMVHACRPT